MHSFAVAIINGSYIYQVQSNHAVYQKYERKLYTCSSHIVTNDKWTRSQPYIWRYVWLLHSTFYVVNNILCVTVICTFKVKILSTNNL